jgi:midasin
VLSEGWGTDALQLLRTCNHATLVALLQPVVQPLLACVQCGVGAVSTAADRLRSQQLLGVAWVLLGALRLYLVAPPLGIDPAGKHRFAARHAQATTQRCITPQAAVRGSLAALPGGPDESEALSELAAARGDAIARLSAALRQCVPRPVPSRYAAVASEVADFAASFAAPARLAALLAALCPNAMAAFSSTDPQRATPSSGTSSTAAAREASSWVGSAGAWVARFEDTYPEYRDVVQPVQLAVQELRHGLGLLIGTFDQGATTSSSAAHGALAPAPKQYEKSCILLQALMAFPSNPTAAALALSHPGATSSVYGVAARVDVEGAGTNAAPAAAKGARMAEFTARLQLRHSALWALARRLIAAGRGCVALVGGVGTADDDGGDGSGGDGKGDTDSLAVLLSRWEQVLGSFMQEWEALKAHEAQVAEEEAEMFKTKTRDMHMATEEVGVHAVGLCSCPCLAMDDQRREIATEEVRCVWAICMWR